MRRVVAISALVGSTTGCLTLLDAEALEDAYLVTAAATCEPSGLACYEGPEGTEGVGACRAGALACAADGGAVCEGAVTPVADCGFDEVDEDCDGRTGRFLRSTVFQGAGVQRITEMATRPDGGVVLAGYAWSKFTAGDRVVDPGAFLVDIRADGVVKWVKSFGAAKKHQAMSVALAPDGSVLAVVDMVAPVEPVDFGGGAIAPTAVSCDVLVKLGPTGEHEWSRPIGDGSYQTENAVVTIDEAGRIALTGNYREKLVWPEGPEIANAEGSTQMYVAALDAKGSLLWIRDFGKAAYPKHLATHGRIASSAVESRDGTIAVAGHASDVEPPANLGGEPLGFVTANFILGLDAFGKHQFSRTLGTHTEYTYGRDLAYAPDGALVVAFNYDGTLHTAAGDLGANAMDLGVVYLEPGGTERWARRYGGPGNETPWAVALAPDGDIVIGGALESVPEGACPVASQAEYDAFSMKLAPDGSIRWLRAFGDPRTHAAVPAELGRPADLVAGIGVAADGTIALAGEFRGAVDWGGGAVTAFSPGDMVVGLYAP